MASSTTKRRGPAGWLVILGLAACHGSSAPIQPRDAGGDGARAIDGAPTPGDVAADAPIDAALPACPEPTGLGRGLTWVRTHPMMISAISVAMGEPDTAAVAAYFTGFHANTVHVWENGLPAEIAGWSAAGQPGFRYLSWVDVDGTSVANRQVLGGAAPLPGRIGYQIGDEPTDAASLAAIAAGAAAVKAADPDGLRIINLNSSDGANQLRTQAVQLADIDVLSYDHYTWGTGAHAGLAATRAAALAAGKPYWRYMKSYYDKTGTPAGDESDLRWDAFVGAVYGFTGYTWFVYSVEAASTTLAPLLFTVGGDFVAPHTAAYDQVATINAQLAQLGRALVRLHSVDVSYVASILNVTGLPTWSAGAGGDPYLQGIELGGQSDALVGHFRDDCGEAYVMIQDQAHTDGDFPDQGTATQTLTLDLDFAAATDPSLDRTAVELLDLTTGAVTSVPLTSTGATTATLTLTLPPGGVALFKYKTARPFALQ